MNRASAGRAREALRSDYRGTDIRIRREFGALTASAYGDGGTLCFSLDDLPGVLAALLCDAPEPDEHGDGGETTTAHARLTA